MSKSTTGTRERLLEAARTLIWPSSYSCVSVEDICRAAGVNKGSFYHFFPSKLELALTAMEEHFTEYVQSDMTRIFASNVPFDEQIDMFADSIMAQKRESLAKYGRVCGCPLAALGSEMIGQEQETIVRRAEDMFARARAYIVAAIRSAVDSGTIDAADPETKAMEVHDFITGLMMVARVHNSLDGLERDLKPGMRRILGLENPQKIDARNSKI